MKPIKLNSSEVDIWFTSDLHFGHRNIIDFCNRPWKTTEEMDEVLMRNWNSVVKDDDIIFDLGDFAYATTSRWKYLIQNLKGRHFLIKGNHDESRYPGDHIFKLFEGVYDQLLLKIDNYNVYLNHYPFLCYGGAYRKDTINLFGHVHSGPYSNNGLDTDRLKMLFPTQYDVGVDNNDYYPISWKTIKDIVQKRLNNQK